MGYFIIFTALLLFGIAVYSSGKNGKTKDDNSTDNFEAERIRRCMQDACSYGVARPIMYCSPDYFYSVVIKLPEYQKIIAPSDDKLGYIFGMPIYAAYLEKGRAFIITNKIRE